MMSARGTMTSTTRRSRSARMFCSMVVSCGEKPWAPAPAASTSLRSARIEFGVFQPNSVRSTRAKKPSPLPLATSLGRGTGTGRLRASFAGAESAEPCGSESGMEPERQALA